MGIRAHLQRGKTKPGLVLPAEAAQKVNEYADKSTLEKFGDDSGPTPNVQRAPAAPSKATLTSSPVAGGPDQTRPDIEAQARADAAELQHAADRAEAEKRLGPDDLTEIDGIGEALQQKVYAAGYKTYAALAEADKAALAEISGISDDMAREITKQAKKLAKSKAKAK